MNSIFVQQNILIILAETIEKCIDDGNIIYRVFVDLQKAFDFVNHETLKWNHYRIRSKQKNYLNFILETGSVSIGFCSQTILLNVVFHKALPWDHYYFYLCKWSHKCSWELHRS